MTRERRRFLLANWLVASLIAILGVLPATFLFARASSTAIFIAGALAVTSVYNLLRIWQTEVTDGKAADPDEAETAGSRRAHTIHV